MKKAIYSIFVFAFVFSIIGLTSAATESTVVTASIKPAEISFSVPDVLDFGELTQGYKSTEIPFSVANTGETDIRVEVSLDESYDGDIFQNLKFRKDGTVTARTLSSFYLTINKPEEAGENSVQNAFAWLDLSSYKEDILEDFEEEAVLVFTAMPN